MRIAFLEDDMPQAMVIEDWLLAAGHSCSHHTSAKDFLADIRRESYELLLIDWELPESSGIEVLKQVRELGDWKTPIMFMTNRVSESDIVKALSSGADDYLTKPASRKILLARITALGRRSGSLPESESIIRVGEYEILSSRQRITRDGEEVELTEKEFKIAVMMLTNLGQLFSRNHILEVVWGVGPQLKTRTVDTHVSRIRQKLSLFPEHGWRLRAVYNFGYRLDRESDTQPAD